MAEEGSSRGAIVAGGLAVLCVLYVLVRSHDPLVRPRHRATRPSPAAPFDASFDAAALLAEDGASDDADAAPFLASPVTIPARKVPSHPMPSSSAPLPPPSQDAQEILLIQKAQEVLVVDPSRALDLVETDLRKYPDGLFREDAEVLAIDALVHLGRKKDARARAQAFREAHPGSAHLARIEQAVGAP